LIETKVHNKNLIKTRSKKYYQKKFEKMVALLKRRKYENNKK